MYFLLFVVKHTIYVFFVFFYRFVKTSISVGGFGCGELLPGALGRLQAPVS